MIKRHVSFSQLVTMLRLTLMYDTDFISFMENPQNDKLIIIAERANSPFIALGGLDFKNECGINYIKVISQGFL